MQLMHDKELFLLLMLFLHNAQKVRTNIDNEAIRLQLQKRKVLNIGTIETKTKKVLVEQIRKMQFLSHVDEIPWLLLSHRQAQY